MMNSLKLYADNLLCMDLCCWPHGEARAILGDEVCVCLLSVGFIDLSIQMMHHLQRRKDNQEIWGCRHIVEARFGKNLLHVSSETCSVFVKMYNRFKHVVYIRCVGLHPDGIPCQKKTASKFENITRDVGYSTTCTADTYSIPTRCV